MSRKSNHLMLLGAALAGLALTGVAKATLVMTLTEVSGPHAGATQTFSDASNTVVVDSAPFASGDFTASIDVGSSDENTGTTEASLQVDYVNIKSLVAGPVSLSISLTDDGFTFPGTSTSQLMLSSTAGATLVNYKTGDTLTFQSSAFDSNSSVSTPAQTLIVPAGATASPLDLSSNTVSTVFTRGAASYSLSDTAVLNFSTPLEQENFNGTTETTLAAVPEPISATLLAAPAVFLLTRRRTRSRSIA